MRQKRIDMTEGTIAKQIVLFALPIIGGCVFQQMYSTVDYMFAGKHKTQDMLQNKTAQSRWSTKHWLYF